MSDSVQLHRRQPTRLCRPWDSPGKNTGLGCHFLLQCMKVKVKSLSVVSDLATPWTAAYQAPPSMGVSRQEYCSGVPLPSPASRPYLHLINSFHLRVARCRQSPPGSRHDTCHHDLSDGAAAPGTSSLTETTNIFTKH